MENTHTNTVIIKRIKSIFWRWNYYYYKIIYLTHSKIIGALTIMITISVCYFGRSSSLTAFPNGSIKKWFQKRLPETGFIFFFPGHIIPPPKVFTITAGFIVDILSSHSTPSPAAFAVPFDRCRLLFAGETHVANLDGFRGLIILYYLGQRWRPETRSKTIKTIRAVAVNTVTELLIRFYKAFGGIPIQSIW